MAERAGVSKATVSRVLNKVGPASDETRQRVLRAARELNYAPDPHFRVLGRRRTDGRRGTGNLGLLLTSESPQVFASDPYYSRLFWGLEREAQVQQYHLVVSTVDEVGADRLPRVISDRLVDGVVAHMGLDAELVARIHAMVPVVLVNDMVEGLGVSSLMPDEMSGIRQALAHLRALGHARVTFFCVDDAGRRAVHHPLRAAAFRQLALEGPGRIAGARLVVHPPRTKSLEETAFDQLIVWRASGQMPSALLCAGDVHAIAFLNAASRLGLAVPRDLSIIGIDDTAACEYVRPRLTSIRQPFEAMGQAAVRILVQWLRQPEPGQVSVTQLFEVQLIERDSCGPYARSAAGSGQTHREVGANALCSV